MVWGNEENKAERIAAEALDSADDAHSRLDDITESIDSIQAMVELIYQHQNRTWQDSFVELVGRLRHYFL